MINRLISIIIPSHNSAQYIKQTLDSVLAQAYRPLEVIVVDDASTDGTPGLVEAYGDRVRCLRQEKNWGGPSRPRNIGMRNAQGKYIAIFDSDDLMLPGKLEEQVQFLESHAEVPFVFTNFRNFSAAGEESDFLRDHVDFHRMPKQSLGNGWSRIRSDHAFETLLGDNFIGTSGVVFRRSLVETIGEFDESIYNNDDIDFWFRTALKFDLGYIDKIYHKRRVHPKNISSRPEALRSKLAVFERQRAIPKSKPAEQKLNRFLSEVLFAIGYSERLRRRPIDAIRYYWQSWLLNKSHLRVFKSMLRALLPF